METDYRVDVATAKELIAGGENLHVEFKRRTRKEHLNDRKLVEAISCMANGEGGHILVGVDDDGTVTGCMPWHGEVTDPRMIESMIQHRTVPALPTVASVVNIADKEILAIYVPRAETPVATQDGVYQRRLLRADGDPQCVPMDPSYLFSRYNAVNSRDWARTPALGATMADINILEIERMRKLAAQAQGDSVISVLSDEEVLRALGVVDDTSAPIKLGAILLFGTERAIRRWLPNHEIVLQVMEGTNVRLNYRTTAPLLAAMEDIANRLDAFRRDEEINIGVSRIAAANLPERVAREAIANAVAHRDYTALGAVHIRWEDSNFYVTNPGGLPRSVTLQTLVEATSPRSPLLSDALKRAGFVERSGRGVKLIYELVLKAGHDEPDYSETTDESVRLRIPTEIVDHDFVRFVYSNSELTLLQLRIVHALHRSGPRGRQQFVDQLHCGKALFEQGVADLVDRGIVDVRGNGEAVRYLLATHLVDDGLSPEEKILSQVQREGQITRKQAAELVGVNEQKAYRILKALAEDGVLRRQGTTRASFYEVNT